MEGILLSLNRQPQTNERLALLQAGDLHRKWISLDDQRVCVLCHRLMSGHEIRITTDGQQPELHCATDGCQSKPVDWFYYGRGPAPQRPAPQAIAQTGEVDLDFF